jgi:hypothetical protein
MPFNFVAMLCLGKMTEKFYFQFGWYVAEIYGRKWRILIHHNHIFSTYVLSKEN